MVFCPQEDQQWCPVLLFYSTGSLHVPIEEVEKDIVGGGGSGGEDLFLATQ